MKTYILFTAALCTLFSCAAGPSAASVSLTDTKWILREIDGKVAPASGKEAFIVFSGSDKSFSGSGGVNAIRGTFEPQGDSGIKVSPLIRTMMAGPNLETENAFVRALEGADSYNLGGDELVLSGAGGVLRFRAGK